MSVYSRRRTLAVVALAAVTALGGLAACSKKNEEAKPGEIKLTVDSFGEFGYDELIKLGVLPEPSQATRPVIGTRAGRDSQRPVNGVPFGFRAKLLLRERQHCIVEVNNRASHSDLPIYMLRHQDIMARPPNETVLFYWDEYARINRLSVGVRITERDRY